MALSALYFSKERYLPDVAEHLFIYLFIVPASLPFISPAFAFRGGSHSVPDIVFNYQRVGPEKGTRSLGSA